MTLPLAFINGLGIGPAEMGLVFFMFLLLFGAKKLPEIARTMGKLMEEMRRASNEFKSQLHEAGNPIQEIRSEVTKEISAIQVDTAVPTSADSYSPPPEDANLVDYDALVPTSPDPAPAAPSTPVEPAPPAPAPEAPKD